MIYRPLLQAFVLAESSVAGQKGPAHSARAWRLVEAARAALVAGVAVTRALVMAGAVALVTAEAGVEKVEAVVVTVKELLLHNYQVVLAQVEEMELTQLEEVTHLQ